MSLPDTSTPFTLVSLRGRMRRSRIIFLYFALVLLAPVMVWRTVANLMWQLEGADIGLFPTSLATVDSVDARWPGVERGDQMVAVGDRQIQRVFDFQQARHDARPGPIEVTFRRGERTWTQEAHATEWTTAYRTAAWIRITTGALLLGIGIGAFLLKPVGAASWLFLLFCFDTSGMACLSWLFRDFFWAGVLYYPLITFGACIGLHVFLIFPSPVKALAAHPRLVLLLYLPFLLGFGGWAWFLEGPVWYAVWGAVHVMTWSWMLVSVGLVITRLVVSFRIAKRLHEGQNIALYRTLLVSIFGGAMLPAAIVGGFSVLGVFSSYQWVYEVGVAAMSLLPALLGYTIVRYNALAVDRFTAAALGYGAALTVVATAYGAVLLVLWWIASRLGFAGSPPFLIGATAGTIFTIGPLYRRVKKRVDSFFLRDYASAQRSMERLHDLRSRLEQATDDDEAIDQTLAALEIIKPERIQLWMLSEDGAQLLRRRPTDGDGPRVLPADGPLIPAMLTGRAGGVRNLSQIEVSPPAQAQLWELALAAAAPVKVHGRLAGIVALGPRASGTPYPVEEMLFLSSAAGELASALARGSDGRKLGRYRLERRLGVGGMAEVFLAYQLGPGGFERRVAIKRPLPQVAEDRRSVAMLLEEARIAARLSHENIAQVFEVASDGQQYFIAMEYVDGPSLRTALAHARDSGSLVPLPVVASIMSGILSALTSVHDEKDDAGTPMGLVHRDVSPGNVLLTKSGQPKLVDFGIARAAATALHTQTGIVRGTVPYMSPEQAAAARVDYRSDLYSAGVIAYELLTLQRPFPEGPTKLPPAPPSMLREELPAAVDDVILRALAPTAAERFASGAELRDALVTALGGPLATRTEVSAWMAAVLPASTSSSVSGPPALMTAGAIEVTAVTGAVSRSSQTSETSVNVQTPPPKPMPTAAMVGTFPAGYLLEKRYRLERVAGKGGTSEVYEATSLVDGSRVAIKLSVQAQVPPTLRERFEREMKILELIQHPHVLRIREHFLTADGISCLVLEWLDGETLSERLRRDNRLPAAQVAVIARAVAAALGAAHAAGVVHRDVNPSNVFLVGGRIEDLRLIDFGHARLEELAAALTRTGMVLGTRGFMSPEQARGDKGVGPPADIYGLGATLFRCLVGQVAVPGLQNVARVANAGIDPAYSWLGELVGRMLAHGIEERPTLAEVLRVLETPAAKAG